MTHTKSVSWYVVTIVSGLATFALAFWQAVVGHESMHAVWMGAGGVAGAGTIRATWSLARLIRERSRPRDPGRALERQ